MSKILTRFKEIGFNFIEFKSTEAGKILEYKYYPNYLSDSHYTLIIFIYWTRIYDLFNKKKMKKKICSDWRLYEHKNENDEFLNTPFQISDYNDSSRNFLNRKITEIFSRELRQIKLKRILKNEFSTSED
jgi:hypothetical protein